MSGVVAMVTQFLALRFPRLPIFFFTYVARFLSYSSIASYRSMLSGVFCFVFPDLSSHFVFHDLRSFRLERPSPSSSVPPWDLLRVLESLPGPPFEPLSSA